ncbi:MAG: hypothetical protein K2P99_06800 [Burkholderiales bacterium]|nr:hypothetical protein [Burkholderiales bacterium]
MNKNLAKYVNKLNEVYNSLLFDFENEKVKPKDVDYLCGQLDTLERILNELNPIAHTKKST